MATFRKLEESQTENEKISSYLERVELFFYVNNVAKEKQVAVLLSVIGAKIYSCKDKSLDQLAKVLKGYFEPKPLVIAK